MATTLLALRCHLGRRFSPILQFRIRPGPGGVIKSVKPTEVDPAMINIEIGMPLVLAVIPGHAPDPGSVPAGSGFCPFDVAGPENVLIVDAAEDQARMPSPGDIPMEDFK